MLLPTSKAEDTEALVRKAEEELVKLSVMVRLPPRVRPPEILAVPLTSKAVSRLEVLIPTRLLKESTYKVLLSTEKSPSMTAEPWTVRRREMVTFSDSRLAGLRMVMPAPVEVEGGMRMVGTLESRELTVNLKSSNLCSREAREAKESILKP